MSFSPPGSLAILPCDGKPLVIAILCDFSREKTSPRLRQGRLRQKNRGDLRLRFWCSQSVRVMFKEERVSQHLCSLGVWKMEIPSSNLVSWVFRNTGTSSKLHSFRSRWPSLPLLCLSSWGWSRCFYLLVERTQGLSAPGRSVLAGLAFFLFPPPSSPPPVLGSTTPLVSLCFSFYPFYPY